MDHIFLHCRVCWVGPEHMDNMFVVDFKSYLTSALEEFFEKGFLIKFECYVC